MANESELSRACWEIYVKKERMIMLWKYKGERMKYQKCGRRYVRCVHGSSKDIKTLITAR